MGYMSPTQLLMSLSTTTGRSRHSAPHSLISVCPRGCFDNEVNRVDCFYQAGAADINPSVSLRDAIATAEKTLDGTYNGHPTTLEFVVQPNGFAALTHVIQIQNKTTGTWFEAFVDAHNDAVLSVTDFVAKASVSSAKQLDSANSDGFFLFIFTFGYAVPRYPIHCRGLQHPGFFNHHRPTSSGCIPQRLAQGD